jgi:purine-binding chemotaxis protein CheW
MKIPDSNPQGKPAVDWARIHQRLESARVAGERSSVPGPNEVTRILKARAQALAREPGEAQAAETLEFVEFVLAHETYGVESSFVREIHPLTSLTTLPCVPPFVLGIVNVRGEILSVIDIKKFFDLPEKGLTDLNKVIVLEAGNMLFGILADAILGVRRMPVSEIQPSLPTLTGIREKYLKGVTLERTVLLDAGKILTDDAIIVKERVDG